MYFKVLLSSKVFYPRFSYHRLCSPVMAAVVLGITADALEEYTPNSLASPLFNCFISIKRVFDEIKRTI